MLALVLVFCLVTCVAPSASASGSSWLELLDYTTLRGSGSNRGDTNSEIWYGLPFDMDLYAVDILIKIVPTGPGFPSGPSVNTISCAMESITDTIFRIYGSSSSLRQGQKSVALSFSSVPYPAFIEILSFRVCSVPHQVFNETGTATLNGTSVAMPNGTTSAEVTKNDGNNFTGLVSTSAWRKYDQVSFSVGVMTDSIGSIDVSYGNITVPADISYFQVPGQSRMYYVNVFIDVSNLDKSYAVPLQVRIAGVNTSNVYALTLHRVFGYIDVASPSPLVFFFNNLFSKLGSWFDGVKNTVSTGFSNLANWLSSGFQSVVNKLDELVTGGSAGDKVSSGGNKIEQSSGSLSDNMDQIQDFEDQQFGNLDAGMGTVIAGGDVSYLVAPLGFIHTYTNKIVAAIPSSYLVVFTLPMLFGVFMFIVGHPIRAPQPDTSGDQVTRETFTTTTVLDGKHKGSTTTTRTVTTSQEIGRRHTE